MTESEAIEAIQFDLKIGGEIHSKVLRDAVDVAIQALEEVQRNRKHRRVPCVERKADSEESDI